MRALALIPLLACAALQAADPAPTMPVSEIRPGMKGWGRTVFVGGKIERFTFEVMGVQHNSSPGRAIIWVRAAGGPLADTGILQGMSGSPCYIEGRLIGAMALGPNFAKDAIGGITPIGEMLEQLKDVPDTVSSRTPLLLPKLEPPKVLKSALQGKMIPLAEILGTLPGADGAQALPFVVSGPALTPEAQGFWKDTPMRFMAAGGSGGSQNGEASPIEPGGMVAMNLMQGDLDFSGFGTITYMNGKRLMLLGHPMFGLGPIDVPLWSATVLGSIPIMGASFKLSAPVAPIGAARLDRATGVGAALGAEAKMVPLRVGLNLAGKKNINYRFEIMDHPFITPVLASTAVSQVLSSQIRALGFQSLALQGNVKVAGHAPIQMEHMVADANSGRIAMFVGGMLQAISMNPFERPVIEGISLTIKAEERLDLTSVAGVRLLKARAKRGEVLPVLVTLQDIQGVRETATLNIPIPASAKPGTAILMVGDGMSLAAADPDERRIEVSSLGEVVRLLNGALRNNHAYALLLQTQDGAGLRGSRIEGIPPAVSSLLGSDGDSSGNRLQRRIIGRALLPLEREVRGLVSLELEIE